MGTCLYCGRKTANPTTCQGCGACVCPAVHCQVKHRSEHLNRNLRKEVDRGELT